MTLSSKKNLAKTLYMSGDLKRKDIASQVGTTEKTLRKWINDGEWDSLKEIKGVTRDQLLSDSYAQLKAINLKIQEEHAGVPTKELSDAKGVLRKEIEALSDQPLYIYLEVMTEYIDWIRDTHPKKLKEMAETGQAFIEEKAKATRF